MESHWLGEITCPLPRRITEFYLVDDGGNQGLMSKSCKPPGECREAVAESGVEHLIDRRS